MINSKLDLKRYIEADNKDYFEKSFKERLIGCFVKYPDYRIMRFKKHLRFSEYYFNTCKKNKFKFFLALFHQRQKNKIGEYLGIELDINCFQEGLQIYHGAGIVVNPNARIGKNCKLHGNNCIGNNGKSQATPCIGDNLDLGFGACVIGDVHLANNIILGANAVVVKDCDKENAVLAGIPAKELKK